MLPNLVIIGAMKSATSSLHYYLDLHPQVSMAKDKELDFFIENKNWPRGVEWYSRQFPDATPVRGESSPNYTKYPVFKGVPKRMHELLPEAKLIYIVRDPIQRILSHYVHAYAEGRESRPIADLLANPQQCYYVQYSKYYFQLEQYLPYYDPSCILVLSTEDLQQQRQTTLQRVFRFLGVDDTFYCSEYEAIIHQSANKRRKNQVGQLLAKTVSHSKVKPFVPPLAVRAVATYNARTATAVRKPTLDEQTRLRLIDYLKEDVSRLRSYTGEQFVQWCL